MQLIFLFKCDSFFSKKKKKKKKKEKKAEHNFKLQ